MTLEQWAAVWFPIAQMRTLHPREQNRTNLGSAIVRGDLAGARYATGIQLFQHAKRQISLSGNIVSVQRILSGYAAMEFELKSYTHRPGMISITDLSQEFRGSHHNAVGEAVFIPRELLGLRQEGPIEPIMIAEDSLHGAKLMSDLERFFEPSEPSRRQFGREVEPLLHLLSTVIGEHRHPTSERVGWWRARNNLIRKYIETNLGDPALLPAHICNMFNLSRATLYRMFEVDGGVRRYIQDRRLYAAIWDLADRGVRRGRLTEVAEKWGFSSNANFNRAVKAAFDMPPGALFSPQALIIPARESDRPDAFPLSGWFERSQGVGLSVDWRGQRL